MQAVSDSPMRSDEAQHTRGRSLPQRETIHCFEEFSRHLKKVSYRYYVIAKDVEITLYCAGENVEIIFAQSDCIERGEDRKNAADCSFTLACQKDTKEGGRNGSSAEPALLLCA